MNPIDIEENMAGHLSAAECWPQDFSSFSADTKPTSYERRCLRVAVRGEWGQNPKAFVDVL